MKILIAYASKHGTTQKCVERLIRNLQGLEVEAVNLEQGSIDPTIYDIVVFGASVYFGKLRPAARRFLTEYESLLAQKPLALFLSCGLTEEYEHYRQKLLPVTLRETAFQTAFFGGSLSTEGLSFFEKLWVRSIRSSLYEESIDNGDYTAPSLPGILPENIDKLATYLRQEAIDLTEKSKKDKKHNDF